jgi:hypothetical protein
MSPITINVCAGGTVRGNTFTLLNDTPNQCTINGLGNLVTAGNSFSVPGRSGGGSGFKICNIVSPAPAPGTSFSYTVGPPGTCGPGEGNPSIIYQ